MCVRLGLTHPQNACGHDDERRQRTDVHQFEQYVDVDETAGDGRQDAEEPGALVGGTVLRVHFAEELREQAVTAHGVADAGLAVQLHQHHRGHADQSAKIDDERQPVEAGFENHAGHRSVNKFRELLVWHHTGHNQRHDDVQHSRHGQRNKNAAWQCLVRIDGLLGGGGDGVEADEAEEHDRRRRNNAVRLRRARLERVNAVRGERLPIGRIDVPDGAHDEQHDDGQFDHHHNIVGFLRLVDANGQHPSDDEHDYETRQVEVCGYAWCGAVCRGQLNWQMQAETFQQFVEITGPSGGHGGRLQCVFQNQIPADHKCDQLAERQIRVRICGTGHWCHCCELCIAQSCETAADRGQEEGDAQCRTCGEGALAGEHENAGADDGADSQHGKVKRFQCAFQWS